MFKLEAPDRIFWKHAKFVTGPLHALEGNPETLDRTCRAADGIITQCCHCRKVRHPNDPERWDWVKPFIAAVLPATSHGLCPACLEWFYPA